MHPVLLLDDVLRQIFDLCTCLPAAARSCRAWTDPALDGVWSNIGSLVPLLNLIPGLICVDGVYAVRSGDSPDLDVFNSYARRIKHITQRHDTRIHPQLLSLLCASGNPILNRLTSTRLSSTHAHCAPAALSLSPSLRQLDLDFGFKNRGHDRSGDYVENLLRIAGGLEHVRLRGLADQRLDNVISHMANLRSLTLRTGTFLTAETLVAISTFPRLVKLDIEAAHLDVDALDHAWSSSAVRFQAIKNVHICAQAPLIELFLKTIPLASLHTLRIEATTPSGSSPVCWSRIFDLIGTNTSQTLHDLTIEQHLDDIDPDTISATSSGTHTQHIESFILNNRITFDIIRRLAGLQHLRTLTINTTYIPNLCDQDIEALATWWPHLAHLDLGSLHSSECHPSFGSPRATLGCLRAFAFSMPQLDTLFLPLDLSVVPSLPPTIGSSGLSRATFSSSVPPPDPAALACYLHGVFPRLIEVEGTDRDEAEWSKVQEAIRSL
ncbi:hypothetical protein C8F04DRAFT_992077 [Mycena alexandri]|uniref:F-box domain-containing protein n=1 Tax=Mycena alexandri TaxID=1745969 RepID=A0AAD6TGW4_9AGAR|nr:hypothetical protein C8F04DRAFT_992077 [Mycena alexandri]